MKLKILWLLSLFPVKAIAEETTLELWMGDGYGDIAEILKEYSKKKFKEEVKWDIKVQTGSLKQALMMSAKEKRAPQISLVPSDYIGEYKSLNLSLLNDV